MARERAFASEMPPDPGPHTAKAIRLTASSVVQSAFATHRKLVATAW